MRSRKKDHVFDYEFDQFSDEEKVLFIGQEGLSFQDIKSFFMRTLPDLVSNIKSLNQNLAPMEGDKAPDLMANRSSRAKQYNKVIKILASYPFLTYAGMIVGIPENFKGNLVAYGGDLFNILQGVDEGQRQLLSRYQAILAIVVTDQNRANSLEDHSQFYQSVKRKREAALHTSKQYFPLQNNRMKVRLDEVLSRWADLKPLVNHTDNVEGLIANINLTSVYESVQAVVDMLDIILDSIRTSSLEKMSTEMVRALAQGALEVGKYIELFGLIYFDSKIYINITDRILEDLQKQ